ncbi:MAG TPA: hypothetical protein VET85_00725 [Stellaceae bacterium]|nr:hypothetical protein [Stellaceae bacterium]
MPDAATLLTVQFLHWIAAGPRTYGEVKQAWRSTCPRLTPWEDAVDEGLVAFGNHDGRLSDASLVKLTPRGQSMLDGHAAR